MSHVQCTCVQRILVFGIGLIGFIGLNGCGHDSESVVDDSSTEGFLGGLIMFGTIASVIMRHVCDRYTFTSDGFDDSMIPESTLVDSEPNI